ncbi:hypothetical protein HON86_03585 [Candidatus Woesearchaeota archaeon]|nr:hypothetical protein [Candidatus Woesearchaeota archaeon]
MKKLLMAGFVILFFILNSSNSVIADNISFDNAEIICTSWLETIISQQGNWNEQENPSIKSSTKLYNKNLLVGYIFHIDPSGYVIIPSINELSPIKSWSETGSFQKIEEYVIENLYQRVNLSLELTKEQKLAAFPKANINYLLHSQLLYGKLELEKNEHFGPLLTTTWHQDYPFNTLAPMGDGGRTFVGCTSLATAQIINYHEWPIFGEGVEEWWWEGDTNCGSSTPGSWIIANFRDKYNYEYMEDHVDGNSNQNVKDAVSELAFEVSAALHTDYSRCGSGASISSARYALINNFKYKSSSQGLRRFDHPNEEEWFSIIQEEINNNRPVLYSSLIHAMVVDGWKNYNGINQIHINYGWAGENDNWFSLDEIETSYYWATENMVIGIEPKRENPNSFIKLIEWM